MNLDFLHTGIFYYNFLWPVAFSIFRCFCWCCLCCYRCWSCCNCCCCCSCYCDCCWSCFMLLLKLLLPLKLLYNICRVPGFDPKILRPRQVCYLWATLTTWIFYPTEQAYYESGGWPAAWDTWQGGDLDICPTTTQPNYRCQHNDQT